MITMVLSNPRAAAVITMVAIALTAFIVAFTVLWLLHSRILRGKLNRLSENAISERDGQIALLKLEIVQLDNKLSSMNARMAGVAVFLGKAVEFTGGRT